MDLRMVKTRAQIKEAFLKLRERLMPEKIKVKDICEMAMINKTTFYNHYIDSAQLSDEIENHSVERVISAFLEREKIFEDPRAYIVGLFESLERESANLRIVFRGKQEIFCAKLEERLCRCYDKQVKDIDDAIRLSFAIGGCIRVVKDYLAAEKKNDIHRVTETATEVLKTLLAMPGLMKKSET